MKMKPYIICAAILTCFGQAEAQTMDPQMLQNLQQLLQMNRLQRPGVVASTPPQPTLPQTTEPALAEQIGQWPAAKGPFEIEQFRDGFSVNKQRILDPEGQIVKYAIDAKTGDYAYLVQRMPGQFVVKVARYQAAAPVAVAMAYQQSGMWTVETATGARLGGNRLLLQPGGVFIARDNVVFSWIPGKGTSNYAAPETHRLAAHQNGDVGATGWILLEKRADTKSSEGGVLANTTAGALFSAVKGLGAALGVNAADADFALFELATGNTVPLAVSLDDKNTQILSQCRQRTRLVSECDRLDLVESLYGVDGQPNKTHYYWRIAWYRTDKGPIAVTMENSIRKIEAVALASNQRVTVFERTLGIGGSSSKQMPDGRVQVTARLGFELAVNEDVAALLPTPDSTVAATPATQR